MEDGIFISVYSSLGKKKNLKMNFNFLVTLPNLQICKQNTTMLQMTNEVKRMEFSDLSIFVIALLGKNNVLCL